MEGISLSAVSVAVVVVGFMVTVGSAVVWLRSEIRKQRSDELTKLVEVRGEKIKDLEADVLALNKRLDVMEMKYTNLMELFESDLAEKVAVSVVEHLKENGDADGS